MALPTSPSTTYVPNSVPVIKSQDLNDLQKYLSGLYNGTYTVASLSAHASVGNMISPATPGTVAAFYSAVVSTAPVATRLNPGTLARGTVLSASATVNANGTLAAGINPEFVGRTPGGNPAGDYTIIWYFSGTSHEPVVLASVLELRPGPTSIQASPYFDVGAGRLAVRVYTWYVNTQTDIKFSVGYVGD